MMMEEKKFSPSRVKADCKNCGSDRWANVVGHFARTEEDEDSGIWGKTDYRILQCPACEEVFFQSDSIFSEDYDVTEHTITGEPQYDYSHTIEHWPPFNSRRARPAWFDKLSLIDDDIFSLLGSVYVALDHGIAVLAAIGIRTVFDRASELLSIDAAKRFDEKLSDLLAAGRIGADEKEILSALTDAGSAAAHRGWKPSPEELETMISIIESFLYRTFLLGKDARNLRAKIPARPKREKRATSK